MPTAKVSETVPFVFELPFSVTEDDLDALQHVNNLVYLRWVQQAAAVHWQAATTLEQQEQWLWVVIRHEIDYLRPAFLGEGLVAKTWVGEVKGARFERHVEIWRPGDSQLLAKARSVWAALDAQSRKPRRVAEELRRQFYVPVLQSQSDP